MAEPALEASQVGTVSRGGNLVSLGAIQVFRLVSGLAINVMVMRGLGVEGFGIYGYVNTLVGLAAFGSSMGMDRLLKREIARNESAAGRYLATALAASSLLSVATGVVILAWAWGMDGRSLVIASAGLAAFGLALQTLAIVPVSYFHAIRRMKLGVPANAWGRLALVVATGVFLLLDFDVLAVFGAQVLDAALALAILWYTFRRLATKLGGIELGTTWAEIVELLRVSIPFGLNALFVSVYLTVDVVLVQLAWGDAEVGLYRGAVMLLTLLTIVAETLSTGIFPRMATHLGKPAAAGAELAFASRILLALAVPAAVGGMMTAEPLMVLFGGQAFASSAAPFLLMAPLLPFRFLSNGAGMALSALDQQGDRTRGALIAAVLNVAVNLYVIPRYGAMGAAGSTLLTEIVLWAWMQWRVSKVVTGLGLPVTLVRVALPAAAMAGALWALPELPVILSIVVGIGVYGAGALWTGALDRRDLARLRGV